jgi:hypothetical protein
LKYSIARERHFLREGDVRVHKLSHVRLQSRQLICRERLPAIDLAVVAAEGDRMIDPELCSREEIRKRHLQQEIERTAVDQRPVRSDM